MEPDWIKQKLYIFCELCGFYHPLSQSAGSTSLSVSWLDFSLTHSHCTTVSLSVRYHRCYLPPSASPIFKFFSEWQFTLAWPGTFASAEWLVQHPSLMEKPMMHCIRQVCQFTSYSLVCYYQLYMILYIVWILIRLDYISMCHASVY